MFNMYLSPLFLKKKTKEEQTMEKEFLHKNAIVHVSEASWYIDDDSNEKNYGDCAEFLECTCMSCTSCSRQNICRIKEIERAEKNYSDYYYKMSREC